MILIQSLDSDFTTTEVIKWLVRFNVRFVRLDNSAVIKRLHYIMDHFIIELNNDIIINTNDITAYWYRRGEFQFTIDFNNSGNRNIDKILKEHLFYENSSLMSFFLYYMKNKIKCIGDFKSCTIVNKNIILETAKSCGLKTPPYIITSEKKYLTDFFSLYNKVIVKSLDHGFNFSQNNHSYAIYTERITKKILATVPEKFAISLFQQEIIKKFEIRTFFLAGEFYSMAIFSQNDEQTKTDFRIYNNEKPNRCVPFKIPIEIESKLHELMKILDFESGSIDIIYGIDNNFYFLEINPIGQLGMVSYPCNYMLEKEIAKELIRLNNKMN